ncbi:unnamed protein product [Moneuplotes crassus]|uniref:Transmembrane protein n=1 Tax=Euplotes crassus TaxID=5936 RepID=A0AAD1Y2R6_EUPCR|nr:unnamed protein product [Moneuplotes crassus]
MSNVCGKVRNSLETRHCLKRVIQTSFRFFFGVNTLRNISLSGIHYRRLSWFRRVLLRNPLFRSFLCWSRLLFSLLFVSWNWFLGLGMRLLLFLWLSLFLFLWLLWFIYFRSNIHDNF